MKYKTILVDDEPLALERLQRLLEPYRDTFEVAGTASSGTEAVEVINRERPDVIFLDIQMPELTGFDVLERLDYMPLVIFSTAYDEYALKAFEVNSVDYLVKPVDPRRLEKTVDKLARLSEGGAGELRERLEQVMETLNPKGAGTAGGKHRIQVRTGDKIRLIPVADVVYFLASEKYVEVHTRDGDHLITKSLTRLEADLPADDFARVHRSAIVNINFIDEITRDIGGAWEVRMKDKKRSRLPVSRRYRSRLDLE